MSQLEEYRAQIDAIDAQLVPLFLQRMEITEKVGTYKMERGLPVMDAEREKRIIAARTRQAAPEARSDVASFYESIIAISRRQQRKLVREGDEDAGFARWQRQLERRRTPISQPRVVYQGEPGAYSEEAAAGLFGETAHTVGLPWFSDVFEALAQGQADYAVVPVENSSTGSIRQVYDLLAQYDFSLVGEWEVKVEHCLAALPGVGMEQIQTVYSHEQGLMQCDRFLDAHRNWQRTPTLDTAGSAKQVSETGDRKAAAICSRRAARLYGLHILAGPINYNAANVTRFVAVSPVLELREGRDKLSAVFSLPHQSGSLHEILTVFAVHGLNLVKLESRPIPARDWEYLFFLECTGDLTAPGMDGVLHELSQLSTDFRVLGNFKSFKNYGGGQS